jgi:hypothetical protein
LRSLFQPLDSHGMSVVSGRALVVELVEDVAPGVVVGLDPVAEGDLPVLQLAHARPRGHLGPVERDVLGGPQHAVQLDQGAVRDRALELGSTEPQPEPAPRDHLGTRRHRGGGLDLQQRQVAHQVEQIGRPCAVEQLGADGDPARLGAGEPVGSHRKCPITAST